MRYAPLLVALLVATPAFADDVPPAIRKAGELHKQDRAGYIGWRADADMALEGPFGTKASVWKAWIIEKDGQPLETKLLALIADGKPASEEDRKKMQTRFNDPKGRAKNQVYWPYEPAHMAAYTFAPAGEGSFSFKAKLRDAHHGDGSLTLSKDGRVAKATYVPAQLPPRASSAEVSVEMGAVAPDWWMGKLSRSRFAGGIGPLKGGMTIVQKQAGHKRFANLEAARAAAPDL